MASANPFARAARAAVADVLRTRALRSDGDPAQDHVLRIVLHAQSLDGVSDMPRAAASADVAAGAHTTLAAAGRPPLLHIGIDGAERFGYPQVRAFASALVAAAAAHTRVAVRLPGIDLGLDPLDCLEHFIVGLAAAVADSDDTLQLQAVCITEPSPTLRGQYRDLLGRLLSDIPPGWQAEPGTADQWPLRCARHADGAGTGADRRLEARLTHQELFTAFVAMPFRKDMLDTFEFGIRQPSREVGFRAERLDQAHHTGGVLEMIRQRIAAAHVVIADLTHTNPNVFLEIGYAWAKQRPTVLLVHRLPALDGQAVQAPQLPFDVSGQKVLIYETLSELGPMLQAELKTLRDGFLRPTGAA